MPCLFLSSWGSRSDQYVWSPPFPKEPGLQCRRAQSEFLGFCGESLRMRRKLVSQLWGVSPATDLDWRGNHLKRSIVLPLLPPYHCHKILKWISSFLWKETGLLHSSHTFHNESGNSHDTGVGVSLASLRDSES